MKLFTSLCFSLLILSRGIVSAQWIPTANLTVFSENGDRFFLVLNGERYNDVPQTHIRIEELPNPYYNCKIIFEDKSLPEIRKNALMLADANNVMQDVTYRIKKDNKGRNVLRFYSFVPAQQNMTRPANCATYRFGRPNIVISGPGYVETTAAHRQMIVDAGNVRVIAPGRTADVNRDIPATNTSVTTTTTTTTTTTMTTGAPGQQRKYRDNNRDRYNNTDQRSTRQDYNNSRGGCRNAMNQADFSEAQKTISNNGFDETRLSTARQIVAANCMSTGQIATIIALFSFEATKLDFAKYAYEYCVDCNNYFKISNGFSFESSKTELNNYVQSMR